MSLRADAVLVAAAALVFSSGSAAAQGAGPGQSAPNAIPSAEAAVTVVAPPRAPAPTTPRGRAFAFVQRHSQVHAPSAVNARCRANLEIFFTLEPQAFIKALAVRRPDYLGQEYLAKRAFELSPSQQPTVLTASDRSYLQALYTTDTSRGLTLEKSNIADMSAESFGAASKGAK